MSHPRAKRNRRVAKGELREVERMIDHLRNVLLHHPEPYDYEVHKDAQAELDRLMARYMALAMELERG